MNSTQQFPGLLLDGTLSRSILCPIQKAKSRTSVQLQGRMLNLDSLVRQLEHDALHWTLIPLAPGSAVAAVFDMPENGLAAFQIDNGTAVLRNYSTVCNENGPEFWQSGSLEPGFHTLTVTNMGHGSSFKLNYIDYQPIQTTRRLPAVAVYIIVALVVAITSFYLIDRRVRKYLRTREIEEAGFPDYMYPFQGKQFCLNLSRYPIHDQILGHKRSSLGRVFHLPIHKVPSHSPPPPALTRLRSGPIDNIVPSMIPDLSPPQPHHSPSQEIKYSFTRTVVPGLLETQICPPHPPSRHFAPKA